MSVATANKDLRHLKASLNRAVRRGYAAENPARWVKPVREPERQLRILSTTEIGDLLRACPSVWWRAFVAVAVITGMRRGELLALRWEDVDFGDSTVWVRNTPEHTTKSGRERALALSPEVAELLQAMPRQGSLVFGRRDGPARGDIISREFAGLVAESGIRHCTLHDLRRTFVTYLATAGVNAALVQQLAGHSAIATTVKYYTGVMPSALRAAQARLPFGNAIRDVSYPYHGPEDGAKSGEGSKVIKLFPERA